ALLDKRTAFGLIPTAETPADDPLVQPYHFSSHVLLWRALDAFDHSAADQVRAATLRHFTSHGSFAYAVAGADGEDARPYHETNGDVASRHWFAWPVALRALLERDPMLTAP